MATFSFWMAALLMMYQFHCQRENISQCRLVRDAAHFAAQEARARTQWRVEGREIRAASAIGLGTLLSRI